MDPRLFGQLHEIEATHWWFRGRRKIVAAVLDRIGGEPRAILDVGCGVGTNLDLLAERYPGARLHGIDVERDPLRFCRGDRDVPVCQADASALPFASASFDLVAALDTLEHVADDGAALREFLRVLRPGGALLLTVPAFPALWGNVDDLGHHFRRYRRRELVERVAGAGFRAGPRALRQRPALPADRGDPPAREGLAAARPGAGGRAALGLRSGPRGSAELVAGTAVRERGELLRWSLPSGCRFCAPRRGIRTLRRSARGRLPEPEADELVRGLARRLLAEQPFFRRPALELFERVEGAVGRRELIVEEIPRDLERNPDRLARHDREQREHSDVPEREERDAQARVPDPVASRRTSGLP